MGIDISQNLVFMRGKLGETQEQFAVSIRLKRTTYANYEKGNSQPDYETLLLICKRFNVSVDDMLSKDLTKELTNSWDSKLAEPIVHYGVENGPIQFYDLDAAAGDGETFNDKLASDTIKLDIPGFNDCKYAFPIYGHSMYPTYENGCIIICKEIKDKGIIVFGEVYLVITAELRLLKRLQKSSEKGHILLMSDNDDVRSNGTRRYEPIDLPIDTIKHLFLVKGSIKRNQM